MTKTILSLLCAGTLVLLPSCHDKSKAKGKNTKSRIDIESTHISDSNQTAQSPDKSIDTPEKEGILKF